MTEIEYIPKRSPLSQVITRDGETVKVEIYGDGEDGWLLEVIDEYGNSTVWEAPFETDQEALDEVLKTIDEDGIESLIDAPPGRREGLGLDQALSEEELNELDDFLADEAIEESSMDVSTLDGFLTGIAIGPEFVPPSQWFPWVWDMEDGEAEADFVDDAQARRIMSLILRHYNNVTHCFNIDPTSFEPIFWHGDQWGVAEWCEGFILGFMFNEDAWTRLAEKHPKWFEPVLRFGTDDGIEVTKSKGDVERWMNEIEPSLVSIHAYWKEKRGDQPSGTFNAGYQQRPQAPDPIVRGGPKIGRNEPCPCGSGKKFKKCCESDGTPPLVH